MSLLMHIAKTATSGSDDNHDPHVASGLLTMIARAGFQLRAISDILRSQLVKDPRSLDDESRKIEIKWNVWLLREGKVKGMIESLISIKQSIAAALTAITTVSTYAVHSFVWEN